MTNNKDYIEDPRGALVPVTMVKPIDLKRDRTVRGIMERAFAERERLRTFKAETWNEIQDFVAESAKESGAKKPGGSKGNITLTSFDGRYQLKVAVADNVQFNEKLQIAKQLIDQCISKWSADARPEIQTLITDAFRTGKSGEVSTARIMGLRRLNIKDATWKKAMDAIGESVMVASSKSYLRFYERQDDGSYKQIPLDVAAL